ncbi:hypothetical protein VNO77_16518 [Canavalia gladiata]|uniref:FAF domain-containing protein n=1 Tax=Canavalia gladiata TaxID=3824 RepID=A0AAN9QS51_CANGL
MSYSSVCQRLQSSVEPCLMESRVLKLKLSQQSTNDEINNKEKNPQSGVCNWSSLQSLSNISHSNKTENVYVHPAVKSTLSPKSLELCTESLGSETGSTTHDMSLFSLETTKNNTILVNTNSSKSKRLNRGATFPPPLTTIRDFHVRSHRQDGRLILEAFTPSSPQPFFQAHRGNGRLRLKLFESVVSYCDGDGDDIDNDNDYDDGEVETLNQQEACDEEDAVAEHGEEEMGITKFVRLGSCKESGNRVIFGDAYFDHPLSLCL